MNLEELQAVQSTERQSDSLQELRDSFYTDAAEFIADLRAKRDAAAEKAENPFDSPEVARLNDDIETAEHALESLYDRRVGKIVKMASLAAADMSTNREGLTREERDLFETLLDEIEHHRRSVVEDLVRGNGDVVDVEYEVTGGDESQTDDAADEPPAMPPDDEDPAPPAPPEPDPPDDAHDGDDVERRTVRITDDVGAIFGVDEREYDLAVDDVVQLPAENAAPLVEQDVAEFLD